MRRQTRVAIRKRHAAAPYRRDAASHRHADARGARRLRQQPFGGARRIDDRIVLDQQAAFQPMLQRGLARAQRLRVEQVGAHAVRRAGVAHVAGGGQLFIVLGDPERAATRERIAGAQLRREFQPEIARMAREREFRRRIVHHDDMAHARRRRAAADSARFQHLDGEPVRRQFRRARRADDPRADDDDIRAHRASFEGMPNANGSAGSKHRRPSAMMWA
jgi:hypothetical protein